LPMVSPESEFNELVDVMTSGKLGLCIVLENEKLVGIITDGDLRRALRANGKPRFDFKAKEIMSDSPKTIEASAMASEAEELMLKHKIKEIVVTQDEKIVGIIQLYAIGNV
ncbi:CBS domain-containing protein, partial [Campylobacter jejuni]